MDRLGTSLARAAGTPSKIIGLLLVVMMAATGIAITAAPGVAAQEVEVESGVSGTVRASKAPLADVTVTIGNQAFMTGSDGSFTFEMLDEPGPISLAAAQNLTQPGFDLTTAQLLSPPTTDLVLPSVQMISVRVDGGFYTDCSYNGLIAGNCSIDDFCTPDDAAADLCDEVYVEFRQLLDTDDLQGVWFAGGETVDNRIELPAFDVDDFSIFVTTIDAGGADFVWNGSTNIAVNLDTGEITDLDNPNPTPTPTPSPTPTPDPAADQLWYPDFDIDGFGDELAAPIVAAESPGFEFVLDNTDCDDGDPFSFPGAEEVPESGFDEDCDGVDSVSGLEARLDVVLEDGNVCPVDFDDHELDFDDELDVELGKEVTYCYAVRNNGPGVVQNIVLNHQALVEPLPVGDLFPGGEILVTQDRVVQVGDSLSELTVTSENAFGQPLTLRFDLTAIDVQVAPFVFEGVVLAGTTPLSGVTVRTSSGIVGVEGEPTVTNNAGEFRVEGTADTLSIIVSARDQAGVPDFARSFSLDLPVAEPLVIELPELIELEVIATGSCVNLTEIVPCGAQQVRIFRGGGFWSSETVTDADGVGRLPVFDTSFTVRVQDIASDGGTAVVPWDQSNPFVIPLVAEPEARFSFGDFVVNELNGTVDVVVSVEPLRPGVSGAEFTLDFDPSVLVPIATELGFGVPVPTCEALNGVFGVCGPANFQDQVRVAVFTLQPAWTETTEIIKISFQAVGVAGDANLRFSRAIAEALPAGIGRAALVTNGSVRVGPPAATCQGQPVTINMRTGDSGTGTEGPDVILGTVGQDVIRGYGGDDLICAGGGDDLIIAGDGNDVVHAGNGGDYVFGGTGNDILRGGQGGDVMWGGAGNDELRGHRGNDFLWGGVDNDFVRGDQGDDFIRGGRGNDDLRGDRGNERLIAGPGVDSLRGGADTDRCSISGAFDTVFSCEELRGARR